MIRWAGYSTEKKKYSSSSATGFRCYLIAFLAFSGIRDLLIHPEVFAEKKKSEDVRSDTRELKIAEDDLATFQPSVITVLISL